MKLNANNISSAGNERKRRKSSISLDSISLYAIFSLSLVHNPNSYRKSDDEWLFGVTFCAMILVKWNREHLKTSSFSMSKSQIEPSQVESSQVKSFFSSAIFNTFICSQCFFQFQIFWMYKNSMFRNYIFFCIFYKLKLFQFTFAYRRKGK